MIAVAIAICEVAFWVFLLGGLTARYALRRDLLSRVLLVCVPLVDVVLLTVSTVDIARGATADWTHGLAAVYLGISVVFGPSIVANADRRMAHRHVVHASPPRRRADASRLAGEWRLWLRWLLACLLASAVLGAMVLIGGDPDRTRALWDGGGWFAQLGAVSVVWLLLGPGWTAVAQRVRRPALPSRRKEPT